MSEPKLCPFRPNKNQPPDFGKCLKAKCAMWRVVIIPSVATREYPGGDPTGVLRDHVGDGVYEQGTIVVVNEAETSGYCGLVGAG